MTQLSAEVDPAQPPCFQVVSSSSQAAGKLQVRPLLACRTQMSGCLIEAAHAQTYL